MQTSKRPFLFKCLLVTATLFLMRQAWQCICADWRRGASSFLITFIIVKINNPRCWPVYLFFGKGVCLCSDLIEFWKCLFSKKASLIQYCTPIFFQLCIKIDLSFQTKWNVTEKCFHVSNKDNILHNRPVFRKIMNAGSPGLPAKTEASVQKNCSRISKLLSKTF